MYGFMQQADKHVYDSTMKRATYKVTGYQMYKHLKYILFTILTYLVFYFSRATVLVLRGLPSCSLFSMIWAE